MPPLLHLRSLSNRHSRRGCLSLRAFAVCASVLVLSETGWAARSHTRSIAAFHRAEIIHRRFEAKPAAAKTRSDYERALNAYRAVYHGDPASPDAARSIATVADLLAEEGRSFHDTQLLRDAIAQWKFLRQQYPGSPLRRRALAEEARIQRTDLTLRSDSRTRRPGSLQQFPPSASPAHERQIAHRANLRRNRGDETSALESESAFAVGLRPVYRQSPSPTRASAHPSPSTQSDATIQQVRYWSEGASTRIAVNMASIVDCRLYPSADRKQWTVVFFGTRPAASLKQPFLATSHGGNLVSMRLTALTANQTALVLQLNRPTSTSSFHLSSPDRWIVDLNPVPAPPVTLASTQPLAKTSQPFSLAKNRPVNRPAPPMIASTTNSYRFVPPSQPLPQLPASSHNSMARVLGLRVRRIVIDAGHGGHDSGTLGPDGMEEKNVALDVALRLGHLLHQRLGADVIYTRTTDTFIPLEERTAIANRAHADLFISIHANSSSDPDVRGVETYYLNFTSSPDALAVAARENASSNRSVYDLSSLVSKIALSSKIDESRELAEDVQQSLYSGLEAGNTGLKNRGVKQAPFVVLIGANMPSILAEISFLTNPEDAREMSRSAYRERIAESLYRGVADYVEGMDLTGVRIANTAQPDAGPAASE